MKRKNWKFRLGLIVIIISIPLFLSLPFIPFLNIGPKEKVSLTSIVFITAEITFWAGGFLVGKELFTKYKSYLNPKNWFKTKSS